VCSLRLAVAGDSPAAASVMLPQPTLDTSMALPGLLGRSFQHRSVFVPLVSLSWAARGTCNLAAGWSVPSTALGRQGSAPHATAGWSSPSNAGWSSPRGGGFSARSTAATAQPAQHQRRPQATASVGVLGAESGVVQQSTRSSGSSVAERSDRAVADTVRPAMLQTPAEPVLESATAASPDDRNSSSAESSGHSGGAGTPSAGGAGRRAGAFQRLPMVQLAKEQLSSAQRAARRVPYSRKLKNEAQRERNRYCCDW